MTDMFANLLLANLIVTVGYAFSAIALTVLYAFSPKKAFVAALAGLSNGLLSFYALCNVMIYGVLFVQARWLRTGTPASFSDYVRPSWVFLIVLVVMAFPYCRRHPLGLLLPFGLIINVTKFYSSDSALFAQGLYQHQPAILGLLCSLYCLLLLLLYSLSVWGKRLLTEPPPDR